MEESAAKEAGAEEYIVEESVAEECVKGKSFLPLVNLTVSMHVKII